ncbi:CHAT domain-containing protein [Armatimonas sp.]|uniref:CHAT domain-containing protein n=1 Tax=Armatimonas sp. TaxID=1872638 RepID=UPI00374D1675
MIFLPLLAPLTCLLLTSSTRLSQPPQLSQPELRTAMIQEEKAAWESPDPTRALALYQKALEKARLLKDGTSEASILNSLGLTALGLGRLALALDYYQQTQRVSQTISSPGREATSLLGQGRVHYALGQRETAHAVIAEGVQLVRHVGHKRELAIFLDACGFAYTQFGEIKQAQECLEESERLWREMGELAGVATVLSLRSYLYRQTNEIPKALEVSLATLSLRQTLKDWSEEMVEYGNIARLYQTLGEPEKALSYLLEGLHQGSTHGKLPQAGSLLADVSELYQSLGESKKALVYNQQAIQAYQEFNNQGAQIWQMGVQGSLLMAQGQPERALVTLQSALRLAQSTENQKIEAGMMSKLGSIYAKRKQPEIAREWYEKALKIQQITGDRENEVATLLSLAELSSQKSAVARHYLAQARTLYRALADRVGEARSLAQLGKLERAAGQWLAAESAYKQAIALSESLRSDAGSGLSAQGAFFETLSNPYVGYLTLLVEQGRASEAFAVAQKIKARGLLDLMAGGKIDLNQQLTEEERTEERRRRARCEQLSATMVGEAARNVPGSKKRFEATKAELITAERELAVFQDQLYAKHPRLGSRRAATTVSLVQISKVLSADTALLEFALQENGRLVVFVVTRDRQGKPTVTAHSPSLTPTELARRVVALRAACTNPKAPWRGAAQSLYRALLTPTEARLSGKTKLILCPDRALWEVPFAVLTDRQGMPLLTRFTLSYANSATTWHAAQSFSRKAAQSPKLLVLANPQFDAQKRFEEGTEVPGQRPITAPNRPITAPNRDLFLPRGTRLMDLPGTQREADALTKRFPKSTVYTRSKAQESVVKATASQFQRIHLASHAFVNDAAPLLSSIVLANPTPSSGDDGFLTAREIFDLDLSRIELVVLSACNTARGQTQGGEGVIGLTWALFAAGCPTQVLSQWAVDDSSTATLMTRFYAGLAKGTGKSAALQQAARHVRREPSHSHPYYWAPFVLIGDPR